MYARTRRFSHLSFQISKHVFFQSLSPPINSPTPTPPSHLFPMPSHPFATSHKTTGRFSKTTSHFSQNDGPLFIKRQVTFHKTTGRFSQNDGSFFLRNKTDTALPQNFPTFIAWANHLIMSDKFQKKTHSLCQKKHYLYICITHSHLKTFSIWMLIK